MTPETKDYRDNKKILGIMSFEHILAVASVLGGVYVAQASINSKLDKSTALLDQRLTQVEQTTKETRTNVEDIKVRLARRGI